MLSFLSLGSSSRPVCSSRAGGGCPIHSRRTGAGRARRTARCHGSPRSDCSWRDRARRDRRTRRNAPRAWHRAARRRRGVQRASCSRRSGSRPCSRISAPRAGKTREGVGIPLALACCGLAWLAAALVSRAARTLERAPRDRNARPPDDRARRDRARGVDRGCEEPRVVRDLARSSRSRRRDVGRRRAVVTFVSASPSHRRHRTRGSARSRRRSRADDRVRSVGFRGSTSPSIGRAAETITCSRWRTAAGAIAAA